MGSCSLRGFSRSSQGNTDKAVGKLYGILGPLGFYRRSVFVVGSGRVGVISYANRSATGITFKKSDELIEVIRAASGV